MATRHCRVNGVRPASALPSGYVCFAQILPRCSQGKRPAHQQVQENGRVARFHARQPALARFKDRGRLGLRQAALLAELPKPPAQSQLSSQCIARQPRRGSGTRARSFPSSIASKRAFLFRFMFNLQRLGHRAAVCAGTRQSALRMARVFSQTHPAPRPHHRQSARSSARSWPNGQVRQRVSREYVPLIFTMPFP